MGRPQGPLVIAVLEHMLMWHPKIQTPPPAWPHTIWPVAPPIAPRPARAPRPSHCVPARLLRAVLHFTSPSRPGPCAQQEFKSAAIPEKPTDDDGVTTVVGKTVDDIVKDPTKDVLLEVRQKREPRCCGHHSNRGSGSHTLRSMCLDTRVSL